MEYYLTSFRKIRLDGSLGLNLQLKEEASKTDDLICSSFVIDITQKVRAAAPTFNDIPLAPNS
jgi:hypothetical protein